MPKRKHDDPYADREAARYSNPIPSREFILNHLQNSVGPLTFEELSREFGLQDDDRIEALRRRLAAMERDGQTVRNRRGAYGSLDKMNLVKGRVAGHPEGYGFVLVSGADSDIFLSSRQMRQVLDGDEVVVRIAGHDRRGRPEGAIVEVVEHRTTQLVGRYFAESGTHLVRPDNPRISQDVLIAADQIAGAQPGQIVVVTITRQPSRKFQPAGCISQVLGDHLAPGMETELAIYNYALPHAWSAEISSAVAGIADEVLEKDKHQRVDLRHLPLVTIDGEDAKDFDDAVYCAPVNGGGWRLYVAIADVSHYVKPGDALDIGAYERGNSVYFPGQVVPMLPEKLSNGLCSLKPAVDRLCMVCEMRIDPTGEVTNFRFYEAIMHSRARLTYTQVAAMLAQRGDPDSAARQQFEGIVDHIDALYGLYQALSDRRAVRGAIDFDTVETRILFDAQRKIEQIIPSERTDAHRLIEECMLCANVCAATLLDKCGLPALYRVHEGPKQEKLADLREFLGELGLGLPGGDKPTPRDYQAVLEAVAQRPDADIVQSVMLRSMSQAVYRAENIGHFGLNYEAYSHFTSPIRRYPDLLVHRAIRALLRGKKRVAHLKRVAGVAVQAQDVHYPYNAAQIAEAGDHCSMCERRADEATRSVVNWLKCEYLLDKVGEEFRGVVSAVTGFGLFVELEPIYIDGLVHITGLPKDYYYHEAAHHRLVGERTRRVFRLGDVLQVKVIRVDIDERKIDLELIESKGSRKTRAGGNKNSNKGRDKARRRQRGRALDEASASAVEQAHDDAQRRGTATQEKTTRQPAGGVKTAKSKGAGRQSDQSKNTQVKNNSGNKNNASKRSAKSRKVKGPGGNPSSTAPSARPSPSKRGRGASNKAGNKKSSKK